MLRRAKARIQGHLNHYAITDNGRMCHTYLRLATRILFKWINRKSQRRAYTWKEFNQVLKWVEWPTARILVQMSPVGKGALPRNV